MLKSIQQSLLLALSIGTPLASAAATINEEEARNVAAEFFQSGEVHRLADKDAFILAHVATDDYHNPVCYVFNAKDGHGFVIVSADQNSLPVIGYSDTNTWSMNAVPDAAKPVISTPVVGLYDMGSVTGGPMRAASQSRLLTTPSWSQEAPFNNNIPNRRLTGCVGVAVAEIMKYYTFPVARPASMVNEGENSYYGWSSMRDDNYRSGYTGEEANEVATLVADAAIAIGTDFGMSSSSAFEVRVPYALNALFGYDAGVSYKKRSEMDRAAWDALIVNEIDEGRPVLYSGQDVSSGHAFVCDGYEMRGDTPFFHINWGWGGSANGYFASDALNPVVSRAHSYNDLMTVVYNIKPATNALDWSPIHVTSDDRQVGLTLDVTDVEPGSTFTARVGALKNISNDDFSGKLAVALFDANGNQKGLLNEGRNFSLISLQTTKYVDFTCQVPSGLSVAEGDVVRLVTKANDSDAWRPVAGDLLAPGEVAAKGGVIPYFSIDIPAEAEDVEISYTDNKVIKGRDYSFKVVPLNAEKVVTVKANGYILTADNNNGYKVTNVLENQRIDIIVQNAADVLTKSTLWLTAGNLKNLFDEKESATVTDLTLFGTMNAEDFAFIRERMKLSRLDISQCNIVASGGNPANAIPKMGLNNCRALKTIILPNTLTTFKNGCLSQTGLTSIEIPASVGTWEYNVFVACSSLHEVIVRRATPAWINWCVFNGDPKTRLVVPVGSAAAYQAKEYWNEFKEIVEENAVAPSTFKVTVQEKKGLKFTEMTEGTEFEPGATFSFKAETDDTYGDSNMAVYANSTRLTADANGMYSTKINANTLIHVEFSTPQATTVDKTWKLSGVAGGIGLVTDVVNVPQNKSFTVRANAIKVPGGDDAAKFYGMVLTDKNGGIKEFISSIVSNYYNYNPTNLTYNFYCSVKESQVKEGNQIRLATSYNKKDWQLVEADADSITDRLDAIGNPVVYHNVVMPTSVTGAKIEGGATQVVRGMPFSLKVSAINPAQRVTVAINGEYKANNVSIANISVPAVLEDLDITILVTDAGADDYMVFNIQEGQLASKLAEDCPVRVKLIGTMHVNDFDALRAHATTIVDLDLSDVTIKGAMMTGNAIPENAFAPTASTSLSALRNVILPNNIERINKNAFNRCTQITELTIPANVNYIGDGAFSYCVGLKKIIAKPKVAPTCGNATPFPSNPKSISLEVPKGSEASYSVGSTWWSMLTLYQAPAGTVETYYVKYDPSRVVPVRYNGSTDRVQVGADDVEVMFCLPNNQSPSQFRATDQIREGVAFRLYDNDIDVFSNLGTYINGTASPEQSWSMVGGRLVLRWLHGATSGPWVLQNHEIKLDFYYSIYFQNQAGAQGVQAEIVEVPAGCEWRNVAMYRFQYQVNRQFNSEVKPVLYKEGSEIKFKLSDPGEKTQLVVNLMSKVMTKSGQQPEYEEREMTLEPIDGIYTIPALEGDTWIRISGVTHYDEGDPIPADDLSNLNKEDVEEFTDLTVTGEMNEQDFENIREKFESLENLDLSQINNEVIPAGAFAGMENLHNVLIPPTVTEIGEGAFQGCDGIETITLPGVNAIGEGAFEGCSNLKSILIPSSDATTMPTQGNAPMKRIRREGARNGNGITAESFRGLNPNCLIYIGANEIPGTEALNIILNQDGTRVAASDIILDGGYPFSAPASFNLGANTISLTMNIPASLSSDVNTGWHGIMLPFTPTSMEYGVEIGEREGAGIHLLSFDGEDSETLTAQTAIVANHPYLVHVSAPYESVPVTFKAAARTDAEEGTYDIPFTPVPESLVAVAKNFSLYGSFDGETTTGECYAMDADKSKFVRPTENDSIKVGIFDAYLCANHGSNIEEFAIGEHPLWVVDPSSATVGGTQLYRSESITLTTPTNGASIYYTVDGSDPTDAEGTRRLYEAPFTMEDEEMVINAVAEYKGNVSDAVSLDFHLRKVDINYDLAQNWNWISHNMENAVAVADFANDGMNRIVSQTQEVIRDANLGLVGTLKTLNPLEAYKVFAAEANSGASVKGVAFDPYTTVSLHKGWNWIGSPVEDGSLLISDLLANLEVEEGEMLVGLEGFEQVDAEGAWTGTLTALAPAAGYLFYSNSDKEFVYNITPASSELPVMAKAPAKAPWAVDIHKYPSVMPVTAVLELDGGHEADVENYAVAAFCGDECRGIGVNVNGTVMINVHGNNGDVIRFRFINPADKEMISTTAIAFEETPAGTLAEPFRIAVGNSSSVEAVNANGFEVVYENGKVVVKGDLNDVESIEVYGVDGMKIAGSSKVANGEISVNELEPGIHIVVIRKGGNSIYEKVLVK